MKDINTIQAVAFTGMLAFGSILTILLLWLFKGPSKSTDTAESSPKAQDDNYEHTSKHFDRLPDFHKAALDIYPHHYDSVLRLPPINSRVLYRIGQNYESVAEFLRSYPVGKTVQFIEYVVPVKTDRATQVLASSVDAIHSVEGVEVLRASKVTDTVDITGLVQIGTNEGLTIWCADLRIASRHTVTIATHRRETDALNSKKGCL